MSHPTAYLQRGQFLTANPTDSLPVTCQSRRISLAAGNYVWGRTLHFEDVPTRLIRLAAGGYSWQTCLDPRNGFYTQTTTLNPDNPSHPTATTTQSWTLLLPSGDWFWGSFLDPQF